MDKLEISFELNKTVPENFNGNKTRSAASYYGKIKYNLGKRQYSDSGGYLLYYAENLLNALVSMRNCTHFITAEDGDHGISIEKDTTNDKKLILTIYSGKKNLAVIQMDLNEFKKKCIKFSQRLLKVILEKSPESKQEAIVKNVIKLIEVVKKSL